MKVAPGAAACMIEPAFLSWHVSVCFENNVCFVSFVFKFCFFVFFGTPW